MLKTYFGNYFTKPKIIFWQKQLFYAQSSNTNLAPIYKSSSIIFGIYFHKAQMLIWHLFYKAQNNILAKTITLYSKPKC